jgi:type II secretory pathway component PulJ
MALLFVVLASVYQSFEIHVHSMEVAREVHRENQVARLTFAMMARDLQSAYWAPVAGEAPDDEEDLELDEEAEERVEEEAEEEVIFLVQPIRDDGRPWDRIAFLSLGPTWSPQLSRHPWVHAVEYRLARDQDTHRPVLVRREDLAPGKDLLSGGEEWALADDVLGFEVLCMDRSGVIHSGWDSRVKKSLPRSVTVRMWTVNPRKPGEEPSLHTLRVVLPPSSRGGDEEGEIP